MRSIRWSSRLQESSLYLLLALLPFSKAVLEIAFGLLFTGWIWQRLDTRTRHDTLWVNPALRKILAVVLVFFAICALSIPFSTHPASSLRALVSKWGEYLLLFIIVADVCQRPVVVRRAMAVTACSALAVAVQSLRQAWFLYQQHGRVQSYQYSALWFYQRAIGPYENPNDLATYLMVVIPLVVSATVLFPRIIRLGLWALSGVLIGCLVYTEAIGAWVGLLGGMVVPALRLTRLRWVVATIGAIALLVGAWWFQRPKGMEEIQLAFSAGARDRQVMWQAALGMIRDRPILGQGLNTFMANYLKYWVGGEQQPRYAHNCYLQVAAETGLLGLAAFLSLLVALFWRLLACLWRTASERSTLLAGLSAGLLAFTLQASVDTNFYSMRQAFLFWTLGGVATGLAVGHAAQPSHGRLRPAA